MTKKPCIVRIHCTISWLIFVETEPFKEMNALRQSTLVEGKKKRNF